MSIYVFSPLCLMHLCLSTSQHQYCIASNMDVNAYYIAVFISLCDASSNCLCASSTEIPTYMICFQ